MPKPGTSAFVAQLPNMISGLRVLMALWFPLAPVSLRAPLVAASGFSDALDGFVARRFRAESWLGGLLDPVADKLFTFIVFVTLTLEGELLVWQSALLLSRDLFVTLACAVLLMRRRFQDFKRMASRKAGKATTLALFVSMFALLLDLERGLWLLLGLTMAASLAATVDYAQSYQRARQSSAVGRP